MNWELFYRQVNVTDSFFLHGYQLLCQLSQPDPRAQQLLYKTIIVISLKILYQITTTAALYNVKPALMQGSASCSGSRAGWATNKIAVGWTGKNKSTYIIWPKLTKHLLHKHMHKHDSILYFNILFRIVWRSTPPIFSFSSPKYHQNMSQCYWTNEGSQSQRVNERKRANQGSLSVDH